MKLEDATLSEQFVLDLPTWSLTSWFFAILNIQITEIPRRGVCDILLNIIRACCHPSPVPTMPSTLNPSGSNDNCFFVTAAYLLGLQSVNELPPPVVAKMNKQRGIDPPDGTNSEMEDCLKQMGPSYHLKS